MKTKAAADRRTAMTTANPLQLRTGSQPFFKKETHQNGIASAEPAFFSTSPVQAKLSIGKPGDPYEKEADAMAEKVVNGRSRIPRTAPQTAPGIQQKCAACETSDQKQEEEKVQAKPLFSQISPLVQRQAAAEEEEVQAKTEKEEEEPVQRKTTEEEEEVQAKMEKDEEEPVQRKTTEEEEEVQAKTEKEEEEPVQRKTTEEEEEVQAKTEKEEEEPVQRRSPRPPQQQPGSGFADRLRSRLGRGNALPEGIRTEMEAVFGADFSSVRIHTDGAASALSQEIQAQAFTRGSDIFFNSGRFDTGTSQGQLLLAHELTHTVQQGAARPQPPAPVNLPTSEIQAPAPSTEAEAPPQQASSTESAEPVAGQPADPLASLPPAQPLPPNAEGVPAAAEIEAAPNSAEEDPQLQQQLQYVDKKGSQQQQHQPELVETANTKRAAKAPANEVAAYSQGRHVGQMEEEGNKVPPFNAENFKNELKKRIEAIAPGSLGEMENFKKDGGVDRVKNEVKENVKDEKANTVGPLEQKNEQPPDQSGIAPKDQAPMPERPAPPPAGQIDAAAATPKPKTAAEWEQPAQAQAARFDADDLENDVDDQQLKEGNEPEFDNYLGEKEAAKTTIAENVQTYRNEEQDTLQTQQAQTSEEGQKGLGGFAAVRRQGLEKIDTQQGETISKDEAARNKVATDLEGIFNTTKTEVERILSTMETEVNTYFDREAKSAQDRFIDFVETELDAYKDRRYSGLRGKARKLRDWWKGLPAEANKFYEEGKKQYIREMDLVIDHVANLVVTGLNDAQKEIVKGREKVNEYLSTLDGDLKKYGDEIAEGIGSKFDALEGTIASKQEQMIGDLAKKYTDNLQQVNAQIERWKEANKGVADKLKDLALGIWRTIKSLAKMLWSIVERIGNVVGSIIKAPVRFFKNLVAGVKQGFSQFKKNMVKHLQAALFGWLFGTMDKAGIKMPESFDLKGIFGLILQVLGLGWTAIRARAVKILGEPVVQKLEQVGEVFKILITDGPGALIQHAMDKVSEFKEKVVGEIKDMVSTEIITAGITFVLGMLTPVGAFIKACKGIYNLIKFFIQRAKDIVALIDAVLNSIEAMIAGKVQVAADKVEDALARFLPLGIGFLASLVGISGIADKVRKIVERVRTKVQEKIIDPVIQKAYALALKAGKFIGDSKVGKMAKSGTAFVKQKAGEVKEKVKAGVEKVKGKIVDWWKVNKKFEGADGKKHTLFFNGAGDGAILTVKSKVEPFIDFLDWAGEKEMTPEQSQALTIARPIAKKIDEEKAKKPPAGADEQAAEKFSAEKAKNIDKYLDELKIYTSVLFGSDLPSWQEPIFGPVTSSGFGTSMNAPILTNVNKKSGSPPSGTTDVYDKLNQRRDSGGSASYYVRGHLLNEKLGGKGTWINMTPLSRVGNKEHEQQFEAITKAAVDGGAIVEYDVKPNYFQRADKQALKDKIKATDPVNAIEKNSIVEAEDQVPLALTCFIVLKERVGNNEFKKVGTERFWSVMNPIDRSPESYFVSGESKFKPVKINSDDSTEIKRLPGISDAAVSKIIATIQRRGQAYGRFEVLKRELVDDHSIVPQEKMDQWLEKNMITLSK